MEKKPKKIHRNNTTGHAPVILPAFLKRTRLAIENRRVRDRRNCKKYLFLRFKKYL